MTATTESKLKTGTLTIAATSYACQATNVRIIPPKKPSAKSELEVLCGNLLPDEDAQDDSWKLTIKAVQDFDAAAGLINYLFDHEGETVAYSWKPSATSPTWSGQLKVYPVEWGGDVNKRLTTDVELDLTGKPTRTPAV